MGIFERLFESKKNKEKRLAREQRQRTRKADSNIKKVEGKIAEMESESNQLLGKAKECLKTGQESGASQALNTWRHNQVLIQKHNKKLHVFKIYNDKLDMAATDQEMAGILAELAGNLEIDPEATYESLDDVADKLTQQQDVDDIWERAYEAEMAGVDKVSDPIPSVEELLEKLNKEVADEVGGNRISESQGVTEEGDSVNEEIGEGRKKLDDLLDEGEDGSGGSE